MLRPRPSHVIAACLLGLALLMLASASTAAASTRVYKVTWRGTHAEAYKASDNTAFDEQRAGYAGCVYQNQGSTFVPWENTWRVVADVRNGHVSIKNRNVKHTTGPRWKGAISDSHISGQRTSPPPPARQSCSSNGNGGKFDCKADPVKPILYDDANFSDDQNVPDAIEAYLPGYSAIGASYRGQSPRSFTCANAIGTNLFPGGFVGNDFEGGALSSADLILRGDQIAKLGVGQKLERTYGNHSIAWFFGPMPAPGDSCAIQNPDGSPNDERCTYTDAGRGSNDRSGTFILKRVN